MAARDDTPTLARHEFFLDSGISGSGANETDILGSVDELNDDAGGSKMPRMHGEVSGVVVGLVVLLFADVFRVDSTSVLVLNDVGE